MASIHFLGAAETVTGPRFLLEHEGHRVLVDAGLFQGLKELRLRNWEPFPVEPRGLDAVVLTHAHIDHTGFLPRLVAMGFRGPVFCTPATRALAGLLLPDSAYLQEEEARYANELRYSRHSPALPLYTGSQAQEALALLRTFGYGTPTDIVPGIRLTLHRAGHILGSAICDFELVGTKHRVVFTGDLGRYQAPILRDPERVTRATTLVAECTYGDRQHDEVDPMEALAEAVRTVHRRKGVLVIPAFAVGRTQELLYRLRRLEETGRTPILDLFVDSPMACDATPLYEAHAEEHDLAMSTTLSKGSAALATHRTTFVAEARESKRLNARREPAVIISASGMATGGRVLHHLAHRLPDERNMVLFVGYQAEGTRGRRLLEGEREIKIHGAVVPVRAEIRTVSGFSAHADRDEMLRWMSGFESPPAQTLLVHGEVRGLRAMRERLVQRGWATHVPRHLERVELG